MNISTMVILLTNVSDGGIHLLTVKRRIFYVLIGFVVIVLAMAARIAWMQGHAKETREVGGRNIAQQSVLQRERGIVLDSGRGNFYDRNGTPLTGKTVAVLVLFPLDPDARGSKEEQRKLARIIQVPFETMDLAWAKLKAPTIWSSAALKAPLVLSKQQIKAIEQLHLNGIRVLPYQQRYDASLVAKHWLGFIAQQPELLQMQNAGGLKQPGASLNTPIGAAGLERTFDSFLRGVGSTTVTYFVDAQKRPLLGLDTRVTKPDNPFYPLKIITTMDLQLQRAIEDYTERFRMQRGAIVVLDTANGDVLAMVSKPNFDPQHVNPASAEWGNRAVKALIPGSIFKVVTAAAALETFDHIKQVSFECRGEYGKFGFSCWKKEGHGILTLEKAFAESCNVVFGNLGEQLHPDVLQRYASMLGLSRQIGWQADSFMGRQAFKQWDGEEAGRIFVSKPAGVTGVRAKPDKGAMVQTAVGQRDVLLSPMQAANMIVTLLNGGEVFAPRIVKEIRYANGHMMASFGSHLSPSPYGKIRRDTANTLMHWMEEVVTEGTGKTLQQAKWKLAGKSGTAQVKEQGLSRNNHWFIGYGPVPSPRYAVAVLLENQPTFGTNQAAIHFRGIMDVIANYELARSKSSAGSRIQLFK